MPSKKAQITVFILLGIVLLMAFGFLYYISDISQPEPATLGTAQNLVKRSLLDSYVTKCLQRTATDAIKTLSQQGGKIILTPQDPILTISDTNKILYGISTPGLPSYVQIPYPFTMHSTLPYPYFGKDNIPALCQTTGPNAISPEYQSCLSYSQHNSIQEQLKDYVEQNLETCTKLETLFSGIEKQPPKVEVIMGETDVQFNLEYPITYALDNQIFEISRFNHRINVRLKDLHEFLKDLVREETTNPDFIIDKKEHYNKVPKYKQDFIVERTKDGRDSIITIKDQKSILDAQIYTFKFAVQNRKPIIKSIKVKPIILIESQTSDTIIFKEPPASVILRPLISDPDDDQTETYIEEDHGNIFIPLDNTFVWQNIANQQKTLSITIHTTDNIALELPQKSITVEMKPFSS